MWSQDLIMPPDMFTGLIAARGSVTNVTPLGDGKRIDVHCSFPQQLTRGESIAVNGVCLTVFPASDGFYADVSPETLRLTTLGRLGPGAVVNLERALAVGDRLGGHIVQGHVDHTGEVVSVTGGDPFRTVTWRFDPSFRPLLVSKGSIAVDGISLTVVDPGHDHFSAAIIPETWEKTNLSATGIGDRVNLEFDMMAKYALQLLEPWRQETR